MTHLKQDLCNTESTDKANNLGETQSNTLGEIRFLNSSRSKLVAAFCFLSLEKSAIVPVPSTQLTNSYAFIVLCTIEGYKNFSVHSETRRDETLSVGHPDKRLSMKSQQNLKPHCSKYLTAKTRRNSKKCLPSNYLLTFHSIHKQTHAHSNSGQHAST